LFVCLFCLGRFLQVFLSSWDRTEWSAVSGGAGGSGAGRGTGAGCGKRSSRCGCGRLAVATRDIHRLTAALEASCLRGRRVRSDVWVRPPDSVVSTENKQQIQVQTSNTTRRRESQPGSVRVRACRCACGRAEVPQSPGLGGGGLSPGPRGRPGRGAAERGDRGASLVVYFKRAGAAWHESFTKSPTSRPYLTKPISARSAQLRLATPRHDCCPLSSA